MRTIRTTAFAALAAMLLLPGTNAQQVSGTASGIFVNPVGPAGMNVSGVGTSSFTWGTPDTTPGPNNLSFTGQPFTAASTTPFVLGTLFYYNGSIIPGTHADFVDLQVTVAFTDPAGISEVLQYSLELIGTPNTADPVASADYVRFPATFAPTTFSVGGLDYTLQVLGFAIASQSGFDFIDEFWVFEDASASAVLVASVTVVPEPLSLLTLGGAVTGLAMVRLPRRARRRRGRA